MIGRSLKDPLGVGTQIPERIDPGRELYLIKAIRAGTATKAERDELICGYIRFAIKIASTFSHDPDFVACAFYGIVYAVEHAKDRMYDDCVGPWIAANVKRFCIEHAEKDRDIEISRRTYNRRLADGEEPPKINFTSWDLNNVHRNVHDTVELNEILEMCIRDEVDRKIISMRSEGHSDSDIATTLGFSRETINDRRATLKRRFDKLW